MIYIIEDFKTRTTIGNNVKEYINYLVFDVRGDTLIKLNKEGLIKLLEMDGNYLVNGSINGDEIEVHKFINTKLTNINRGIHVYLLIGQTEPGKYLVKKMSNMNIVDNYGLAIDKMPLKVYEHVEVEKLIKDGLVLNAIYDNGKFKITHTVGYKEGFKEKIDRECDKFLKKSSLLGMECKIDYITINEDVILTGIKSSNKNLRIPEFVTSLSKNSIQIEEECSVTLNNGLRVIGTSSIYINNCVELKNLDVIDYMYKDSIRRFGNMVVRISSENVSNDKIMRGIS